MYRQNTEPHVGQALHPLRTGAVRHGFETFVDPIIDVAYIKTSSSSGRVGKEEELAGRLQALVLASRSDAGVNSVPRASPRGLPL
jgi:hypothetical protein